MGNTDFDYTTGLRVERTLAYLRSIPDPVQRAQMCDNVADQARAIQGKVANIRRQAVYEATLKPGATGASVAAELGVSPKAVSLASKEFRSADLATLHALLDMYMSGAAAGFNEAAVAVARNSRDVVLVAKTVLQADKGRNHHALPEDRWLEIQEGVKRAEDILSAAADLPPSLRVSDPPMTEADPPPGGTDSHLRHLVRTVNCLPGIVAYGFGETPTLEEPDPEPAWYLSWSVLPAERHASVFDAGPHREGWATTEWLVWLVRDSIRGGRDLTQYSTSPPPFLNKPGESLSFVIYAPQDGDNPVDPDDFAGWISQTWDETGYKAVTWPAKDDPADG